MSESPIIVDMQILCRDYSPMNHSSNIYIDIPQHPLHHQSMSCEYDRGQHNIILTNHKTSITASTIRELCIRCKKMIPRVNTKFILHFFYTPHIIDGIKLHFTVDNPDHITIQYDDKNPSNHTGIIPRKWTPIHVTPNSTFADIFAQIDQQWQEHYGPIHALYNHINEEHEQLLIEKKSIEYWYRYRPQAYTKDITLYIGHTHITQHESSIYIAINIGTTRIYQQIYEHNTNTNNKNIICHIYQHLEQHLLSHTQQMFPQSSQHTHIQTLRYLLEILSINGHIQKHLDTTHRVIHQYYHQ